MNERDTARVRSGIWTAGWPIQVLTAAILAAAGIFMLLEPGRAELLVALLVGGYFLIDGVRWAVTRIGARQFGRAGEVESLRAGIGLLTAVLLFGLSFLQAITLIGVRLILAIGAIPFGLLGLWVVVLGRTAGLRWSMAATSAVLVAYGVLLIYTQFVDATAFATILTVVAAAQLLVALVLLVRAIVGRRGTTSSPVE